MQQRCQVAGPTGEWGHQSRTGSKAALHVNVRDKVLVIAESEGCPASRSAGLTEPTCRVDRPPTMKVTFQFLCN